MPASFGNQSGILDDGNSYALPASVGLSEPLPCPPRRLDPLLPLRQVRHRLGLGQHGLDEPSISVSGRRHRQVDSIQADLDSEQEVHERCSCLDPRHPSRRNMVHPQFDGVANGLTVGDKLRRMLKIIR